MLQKFVNRMRDGKTLYIFIGYGLVIIYCFIILLPSYYVILSSFKENAAIFENALAFPKIFNLDNYIKVQNLVDIFRSMGISLEIVVGSELLTILLSFPCAFAVARIPTRLAKVWEIVFGAGFLIPAFALILPIFLLFYRLNLILTPVAVILCYAGLRIPFNVIFLSGSMKSIPHELEESAFMDGASWFHVMLRLIFPLSISSIVTLIISNFIFAWNEYFFAFILMSVDTRTVQMTLPLIKKYNIIPYGLLGAAVVMTTIPVFVIFISLQRKIMQGLLSGAIKS